jgi:hypothetical protein
MTNLAGELAVRHRSDMFSGSTFRHAVARGTRLREGYMAQPRQKLSVPHGVTFKHACDRTSRLTP